MSTYTSRTELEDGAVVAWIDRDGYQMIRQPHHPNAFNNEPWATEAEALAWADATIVDLEENEARQAQQVADQEAAAARAIEDSAKLAEMYEVIKAIQTKLG
jgi:hypothetical protein